MNRSILVVDTEPVYTKNVAQYLRRHGYEVRTVTSAEEALHEMKSFHPVAAVLDYHLDEVDGLHLLRHLLHADPQVKVIMATGDSDEALSADAFNAGACEYLLKPFALSELKRLLDGVINDGECAGV